MKEVYGPYHRAICELPCLIGGGKCIPPVRGHHVKSVGSGGQDHANEVPLCIYHHAQIHQMGRKTFARRHAVDLEIVAARLAEEVTP